MNTTAYAFSAHFRGRSLQELQLRLAILRPKRLRQTHFQFGPSARGKLFWKNGECFQRNAFLGQWMRATACAHVDFDRIAQAFPQSGLASRAPAGARKETVESRKWRLLTQLVEKVGKRDSGK